MSRLFEIRKLLMKEVRTVELVIVLNNRELEETIRPENAFEKVVVYDRTGRGYSLIKGIMKAQGDVILMLHSDTLLPTGWNKAIVNAS